MASTILEKAIQKKENRLNFLRTQIKLASCYKTIESLLAEANRVRQEIIQLKAQLNDEN